jgi:hypothetical protein
MYAFNYCDGQNYKKISTSTKKFYHSRKFDNYLQSCNFKFLSLIMTDSGLKFNLILCRNTLLLENIVKPLFFATMA